MLALFFPAAFFASGVQQCLSSSTVKSDLYNPDMIVLQCWAMREKNNSSYDCIEIRSHCPLNRDFKAINLATTTNGSCYSSDKFPTGYGCLFSCTGHTPQLDRSLGDAFMSATTVLTLPRADSEEMLDGYSALSLSTSRDETLGLFCLHVERQVELVAGWRE